MAGIWNREQIAHFIDLYKGHEVLYNVKHPQYHSRHVRRMSLDKIADDMRGIRPNTTANEIKLRINAMRSHFNAELARLKRHSNDSKVSTVPVRLWYFDKLFFLKYYVSQKNSPVKVSMQPKTKAKPSKPEKTPMPIETTADATTSIQQPPMEEPETFWVTEIKSEPEDSHCSGFRDEDDGDEYDTNPLDTTSASTRDLRSTGAVEIVHSTEITQRGREELPADQLSTEEWGRFGLFLASEAKNMPPGDAKRFKYKCLQYLVEIQNNTM